jgi:nanoRNase/pAp phosphatase (c-di-AMP/oligoRNAs hydrolase)|uniref:Phosphoethanolamine methyltransferase n=1 Tax=Desulfobacca acetoxidans TaxID=60893 RepID=A0A7V6A437_9BACT
MRPIIQRIFHLFSPEDRLLILIDADPDSLASAWALKRLLWRHLAAITISNIRPITRPQNQRMVRLLGIPIVPYEQVNPDTFNHKAIVDSQPAHHPNFARHTFDLIIDHHPLLEDSTATVVDIRPQYGATATIMTEYLRAAHIKPSLKLATALYYAIKTDTNNFERPAIGADVKAFHYLFSFTRTSLVRRLEFAEMTLKMLGYYQSGLKRLRRRGNRLYTFLGEVPTPDIMVILADFLLRVEEISWTIVGGIYEDKLIVIFRNDGLRKNAGRLASRAFGKFGSAGGHAATARAEVPLANLTHEMPPMTSQWQKWQNYIIKRVEGRK